MLGSAAGEMDSAESSRFNFHALDVPPGVSGGPQVEDEDGEFFDFDSDGDRDDSGANKGLKVGLSSSSSIQEKIQEPPSPATEPIAPARPSRSPSVVSNGDPGGRRKVEGRRHSVKKSLSKKRLSSSRSSGDGVIYDDVPRDHQSQDGKR
ncbi:PREDICTED: rho guanine nucleotide exchange factor 10-like protein, partial [Nanorana parkeri]|uniref:rho guanine nucleotide exchange factor 10-like protein n=1 Tax=Nanorana parkeri TaxID=125878 RepID=UPI00085419F5